MTADQYLQNILTREAVDAGPYSPARRVHATVLPVLQSYAGNQLRAVRPSGSFAKGTANKSGTDIDLFVSISETCSENLRDIYGKLFKHLADNGYAPKKQNVSINVKVGGLSVDLVPAKRQDNHSEDHSLYRRRADTWTKTNIERHINLVKVSGKTNEIRLIKLWRDQNGLDFPSFYLELTVMEALSRPSGTLEQRVLQVFRYLKDGFPSARLIDPANSNNIISEELTQTERNKVAVASASSLGAANWTQIII